MVKFALILACVILLAFSSPAQHLTPAPQVPFHVAGKYLLDAHGIAFPVRGNRSPCVSPTDGRTGYARRCGLRTAFGQSERDDFFPELGRLVRRAHDTELLV